MNALGIVAGLGLATLLAASPGPATAAPRCDGDRVSVATDCVALERKT